MTLLASVMLADGVKVAVQVTPPFDENTADRVPDLTFSTQLVNRLASVEGYHCPYTTLFRSVDDVDQSRRVEGVDRVIVGEGGAEPGIARRVRHSGIVQRDDVARVGNVGRRGEGRRPGHATVRRGHR